MRPEEVRIKKDLLILVVFVVLVVVKLEVLPALAFTSPIESPIATPAETPPDLCTPSPDSDDTSANRPPGLENCPGGCVEVLDCVGHPTCNAWCVEQTGADVAPEYISPMVVGGVCVWPTQPAAWHVVG